MNIPIFVFLLFGVQISCLWIGKKISKKLSTQEDYFLAKKRVKVFPLMMTFLATQIGGGFILGSAEEAYSFGWKVLFYPMGASLGLIFLGLVFGKRLANLQVATTAQIFEVSYRSSILKRIASVLSIFSLFVILIAQIVASHKFMASIGVESEIWFILFWSVIIVYTALGGFKAVIATDVLQVAFLVLVLLGSFIYMGPLGELDQKMMTVSFESLKDTKLYGWLVMPLLFMLIEQDMAQRCFAGTSNRAVQGASIMAGLGAFLISLIPIIFGMIARAQDLLIPEQNSVFMTVALSFGPYVSSFIAVAILCAIVSTADSLINAIGSNLFQDFSYLSTRSIKSSQKVSMGISCFALLLSFYFQNILQLLIISYEISISCLFVPIIIALFKKEQKVLSGYFSVIFGAIGFFVFRSIDLFLPKECLSLFLSLLGHRLGAIITTKKKTDIVRSQEINP